MMEAPDDNEHGAVTTTTTTTTTETISVGLAAGTFLKDQASIAYSGVFVCGLVLILSILAGVSPNIGYHYGYGISIGAIGMLLALLGWLACNAAAANVPAQYIGYYNYFLFAWVIVGACFMTFGEGPFTVTGNGK